MKNIIIFASGNGSNAQAIIDYFKNNNAIKIALIVTNNPFAGVLQRAQQEAIPHLIISPRELDEVALHNKLQEINPTLLILAGFLKKIPASFVHIFADKIINLHPALLPKYGGKGMYGMHVHQAVLAAAETQSGITIHYVNEQYDEGNIILQARCSIAKNETPDTLAQKIHQLEHFYLPRCIEYLLNAND